VCVLERSRSRRLLGMSEVRRRSRGAVGLGRYLHGFVGIPGIIYIYIYLICHDFRKINGRIKIFDKCTSGAVAHGAWSSCRRGPRRTVGSTGRWGQVLMPWLTASGNPSVVATTSGPWRCGPRRQRRPI
jgi:hypothetical protein